jgi:DNA-binding CsgD family transcriptional regulator
MKAKEGYRWQPRRWSPNQRERAILEALVAGRTNAEIGAGLGISADGVKWYVSQLLSETGCGNRRELAGWWADARESVAALEHHGPTMLLDSAALKQSWSSDRLERLAAAGSDRPESDNVSPA